MRAQIARCLTPAASVAAMAFTVLASGACSMSWDDASTGGASLNAPARRIHGTISGLAGMGLVLTDTSTGDPATDVSVAQDATSFDFAVDNGATYAISVKANPHSPVQSCVVANGMGRVMDEDVTNVVVVCTTLGFLLGADVHGLVGSLVLANAAQTLLVQSDGLHTFDPVPPGTAYAISVVTQPLTQRCTLGMASGVMTSADVAVRVQCLDSFLEGFDQSANLPSGWSITPLVPTGQPWHMSNASAYSAPNCARVDGTGNSFDTALVTPLISIVRAGAQLRFHHAYETEQGYDGGVLEIQIDNGKFQDITAAGGTFMSAGYTGTIAGGIGASSLGGRNAWTGSSGGYVTTAINLPPAATGKTIALRWRWANDGTNTVPNGGWSVDNVVVDR